MKKNKMFSLFGYKKGKKKFSSDLMPRVVFTASLFLVLLAVILIVQTSVVIGQVMSDTTDTSIDKEERAEMVLPVCGKSTSGNLTVVSRCTAQSKLLRREFYDTETQVLVKLERYSIKNGTSYLRVVKDYEFTNGRNNLVRTEQYKLDADNLTLNSIRWSETETGETEYYDVDGNIVKQKMYDPNSGKLRLVFEYYPGTSKIESVRYFESTGMLHAMLFDEKGDVIYYTDGRGYRLGLPSSVKPVASVYNPFFYPQILSDIKDLNNDVNLMFLGDSITASWRGNPTWDKYYTGRRAVVAGIGKDQTEHLLWRLANGNMDNISPKAVVMNIGTNNFWKNDTVEQTVEGIIANIAKIKVVSPSSTIVLMGIFPRDNSYDLPDVKRRQVNQVLSLLNIDKSILYVDLADQLADVTGQRKPEYYKDNLHLNTAGYEVWASTIEPIIKGLLGS
jgi:lysophospholipase L1-like esterase